MVEEKGWMPAGEHMDMGIKPALIRVTFSPLSIYQEADLHSSLLDFNAPLGSFWVPTAVAKIECGQDGTRMAYQVEKHLIANEQGEKVFHRGWIFDYAAGSSSSRIDVTFQNRLAAAARMLSREEAVDMKEAIDASFDMRSSVVGGWTEGSPMDGQLPDLIRVKGEGLSVRVGPEYLSEKIGSTGFWGKVTGRKTHLDVGEELTPLEHRQTMYDSIVINFYRVRVIVEDKEQQGWLLDFSPGQERRTLQILYSQTPAEEN